MSGEFDPIEYGKLLGKVDALDRKLDVMEAENKAMKEDIKKLLGLAERSKGGLWVGMAIVSGITGIISFLVGMWQGR